MENMPLEYANGLRRALYAESPTVMIDKVKFSKNTSALAEEFIAHRLGMIPIHVTTEKLEMMDFYYQCSNRKNHAEVSIE